MTSDPTPSSAENPFEKSYLEYLRVNSASVEERLRNWSRPLILSDQERFAVSKVLTQTVAKLCIINRGLCIRNGIDGAARPAMSERFKEPMVDKLYDERTLQPLRDCFEVLSKTKLANDIDEMRSALQMCNDELLARQQFDRFAEYLARECREAHDELMLLNEFERKGEELKGLNEQLMASKAKTAREVQQLDEHLAGLRAECEESRERSKIELHAIDEWERTRQEQTAAVYNYENRVLCEKMQKISADTDRELIATNEMRTFYDVKCESLLKSIADWRKRYANEKRQLDERITATKSEIGKVQATHSSIRLLHEQRSAFIEQFHIEQQKRRAQRELEARQCEAAIRIQAWWRATMVRRQLGPYRTKKKSKKAKKK